MFSCLQVLDAAYVEGDDPVKFSTETLFIADNYEIA